jgi:hypothetical protein
MDNIVEAVTLLRQQSELESQILQGDGTAAATEHALEATRRRLRGAPTSVQRRAADRSGPGVAPRIGSRPRMSVRGAVRTRYTRLEWPFPPTVVLELSDLRAPKQSLTASVDCGASAATGSSAPSHRGQVAGSELKFGSLARDLKDTFCLERHLCTISIEFTAMPPA